MSYRWKFEDFNIFTAGLSDALDGQQSNTSTEPIEDVKCCFCDTSVPFDLPPYSNKVCDVRIYCQYHNCLKKRKEFGVCNPIPYGTALADMQTTFADVKDMGLEWVRVDINWTRVQPTGPSTYNWGFYDDFVAAAHSHGLKVLLIINYATPWNRTTSNDQSMPTDLDAYATYCAAVATRYGPLGVKHYEIWNEPNYWAFWQPLPNVAQYTALLKKGYAAIKEVDPTLTVLLAGLAQSGDSELHISPHNFLQGVYDNGGKNYFDAVNFHPYSFPLQPPGGGWGYVTNIRGVMRRNGDGYKKIWLTEYGAPTNGLPGQTFVSEGAQANLFAGAINTARSYPWSGPLFFYNYKDRNVVNTEGYFGIRRLNGTAKPCYAAIQEAIKLDITIINNDTSFLQKLINLCSTYGNVNVVDVANFNAGTPVGDIVVLSGGGGRSVMNNLNYFSYEINFIRTTNKPVIAICLGMEMAAYAYGGTLTLLSDEIKGIRPITVSTDSIFARTQYNVYMAHKWAVTALGNTLVNISSDSTGVNLFRHPTRQMYGLQFHPESTATGDQGDLIFERILRSF